MTTKTKAKNKKRSSPPAKNPRSNRKSKSINSRDVNEDAQQQITNVQRDEYLDEARVEDSNLDNDERGDQITNDVEEQEDREVLRKKDEAQGNEQV